MAQVDPNLSSGANMSRKQAGLAPALFSSLSSSATPQKLAATVKAPHSWTAHQNEEKGDSYRALGRLVAELGKVRETERQRIAQHLHDRIGQNLILAVMKLSWLETSLSRKKRPMVREVHKLISDTIDETRSLVCDLYPQILRELGLRMALEWLLERVRANYGLSCVAELGSVPGSVPREISEIIFQTVRELLVNVAKHARAKRASAGDSTPSTRPAQCGRPSCRRCRKYGRSSGTATTADWPALNSSQSSSGVRAPAPRHVRPRAQLGLRLAHHVFRRQTCTMPLPPFSERVRPE